MLLRGTAETLGDDLRHCAVYDPSAEVGVIIGVPPVEEIRRLEAMCTAQSVILAPPESAEELGQALSQWRCELALLHTLPDTSRLPEAPGVRLVTAAEIEEMEIDAELKEEFAAATAFSPLSVAFTNSVPASFCYAAWQTETLWDVSIDTLPPFQRQGHASRNLAWMIRFLLETGRSPVWGALESNEASLTLAQKLGFVEVDQICVFGK
jgi:GNAT superfamily N-acetyltransferase